MADDKDRFSVLGPVRAWHDGTEVALGSPQQRVVMAVLLLREPYPVSAEELVQSVWGESPPASAVNQLRIYAHRLRRVRERARPGMSPLIESAGNGYRLRLSPGALDMAVFEETLTTAHRLRASDPGRAGDLLGDALSLWQGTPLGDLPGQWAQAQRTRLEQAWLDAVASRLRLLLERGQEEGVAAELAVVAHEHPLDERFPELQMLALYRTGRQAAALEVYAQTRERLSRELGIEPGPDLRLMHDRILHSDDALQKAAVHERIVAPSRAAGATDPAVLSGLLPAVPSGFAPVAAQAVPVPRIPSAWPAAAPAQLPFDLPVFSGRRAELATLAAWAGDSRTAGTGTALCLVTGAAGVGKTAFAVHAAHRLARHYPDGQIHLDLHGFDPRERPLSPRRALRAALDALGVGSDRIPQDLDAQSAMYRSLLADRRVLLLLDNARDAQQIRPLLPSARGGLVLVTSRNRLTALVVRDGARPMCLEPMTTGEARALLIRRLGVTRVDADLAARDEITGRSAGLPLALALIAARADTRGAPALTAIAAELRALPTMLDVLSDSDASLDMRSVISWSYEALAPAAARLFRLTSLAPADGCDLPALAALAGAAVGEVRPALAELTAAHLLDEAETGRYSSHDLLREYAAEALAGSETPEESTAAFRRLLAHNLACAYTAARATAASLPPLELHPEAAGAVAGDLSDPKGAADWLARECESLLALAERAGATPGCEQQTWQLAWSLMDHLQRGGRWEEQMRIQRTALAAAGRASDSLGQAHAHRDLARACTQAGRYAEATDHLHSALGEFTGLGDHSGQARCHGNLALVLTRQGEYRAALPHVHRAVELFTRAGDRLGQALALNNLGWTYANTGDLTQGLTYCRKALLLVRDAGDRGAEAATWDSIGYIHHQLGDLIEAKHCYHRAIDLDQELGDRFNEAETLTHLGETWAALGNAAAARRVWQEAAGLFDELDSGAAERVRARVSALGSAAAHASGGCGR